VKTEEDVQNSDVKDRIYLAALDLFSKKGYDAVSVRELCQHAQTTAPMLYYYFKHKKGLYKYILNEASRLRRRRIEKAIKIPGDPISRLRNVLEAWAGLHDDEPSANQLRLFYLREVFGMGSESYKSSVESFDRQLRHALRDILQEGIDLGLFRQVRVEMAVLAIIGIVNTFIRRVALEAPLKMEDGIEQVMDTFMNGLRAPSVEGAGAVRPESAATPV
jgi:AcrR family transcriptional regulator